MAVVNAPLTREMVRAFAGLLDFYMVRGQVRVRVWPRRLNRVQTSAEIQASTNFGIASKSSAELSTTIVDQWKILAQSTIYTWRDLYIRAYINADKTDEELAEACADRRESMYAST